MKNIAIFGSSRAGKSTLSKMISKKYHNYHIIIGDDIRGAFQEILPNNNINDEHILEHSKYWITKSKEYEKECKKLNIWYVDTSFNRKEVLENTLHMLEKIILEEE